MKSRKKWKIRARRCKAPNILLVLSTIMVRIKESTQIIEESPNTLLTLTWCHRTPTDTPTRPCTTVISAEHQLDDVGCACYVGGKGAAIATALLHPGCPVAVCDYQVVEAIIPKLQTILNV